MSGLLDDDDEIIQSQDIITTSTNNNTTPTTTTTNTTATTTIPSINQPNDQVQQQQNISSTSTEPTTVDDKKVFISHLLNERSPNISLTTPTVSLPTATIAATTALYGDLDSLDIIANLPDVPTSIPTSPARPTIDESRKLNSSGSKSHKHTKSLTSSKDNNNKESSSSISKENSSSNFNAILDTTATASEDVTLTKSQTNVPVVITNTTTTSTTSTSTSNMNNPIMLSHSRSLPVTPQFPSLASPTMPALNKPSSMMFGNSSPSSYRPPFSPQQGSSPMSINGGQSPAHSPSLNRKLNNSNNNDTSPPDSLTPLNISTESTSNRKGSVSKKQQQPNQPQQSPNMNGSKSPSMSSKSGVMQFLGKMSLSKERMSKLVNQSKELHKSTGSPGSSPLVTSVNSNGQMAPFSLVPFEGIFGIPLRVILRYESESGNQIPSILNNIFTILESSTSLSTNRLYYDEYQSSSPIDISNNNNNITTTTTTTTTTTNTNASEQFSLRKISSSSLSSSTSSLSSLHNPTTTSPPTSSPPLRNSSPSNNNLSSLTSNNNNSNDKSTNIKRDIEKLKNLYDTAQEVSLKQYNVHVVSELLIEYLSLLPEPIISVEFYETLLNYYQTETLLHLMIRKMNNPNKTILSRLMKYLKDVLVYTNFNDVTLNLLVDRFYKFIMRPMIGNVGQCVISESHTKTIKDIVSMFIQQADILFQTSEERLNPDDSLILYIEDVAATQKTSSTGNLWLFHKQIVWRPKVNPNGDPDLIIMFNSILKVVLAPQPAKKEQQKILPNFTIYCSSETKTVITFGFQNPATCKLVFAYINSVTKSISQTNRIVSQKLDMYSLDLESLPNEVKQLKDLQELNLNRNKFKLLPGDLARLTSLRTISIEENNLSEISSEMSDFLGGRLPNLENVSLSSNKLIVLPPLFTWSKLKTLNISNNYLIKLPSDIFQIPTLEVLRVSNNQIDDNGIPKLITSTRLKQLDLRKNHLSTIPEGIINLTELQVLTLQDNQITDLTADIQKLTSLTELNLNGNQIQSLPHQLLHLTSLKKLYLDNNQIQSISSAIHRMQSLIELRLTNNNISRLPPGIVALKKLNSLELTGNKPLKDNIPEKYILKGKDGIFAYFSEAMRTNVPCYRTRIMVLGEKQSGKSNLIKCLKKMPKSSFSQAVTTNVLDISDWQCSVNLEGSDGKKKKNINIHLWEFEGMQNDISHVFFVPNITYIVTFNIAKFNLSHPTAAGSEYQKLTSFIHGIYQIDKKQSTIIVVGTHLDEVSKKQADKTLDYLSSRYKALFPTASILYHSVSTLKSEADGMSKLRREIKNIISKNPILKQSYPASFMFLEDYLKEESNLMSPPLVTKKNLQQMARTMELHNEPHFSQLKSLFNSLGSITSFEQFVRLESGSTPTKTEMISLNPIWIAKAIASLVCFNPQNLPFSVNLSSEEEDPSTSIVPGILPHRVLRFVWGTNSQYYVPERFFSLFLSLLETNDLAINIYTLDNENSGSSNKSSFSHGESPLATGQQQTMPSSPRFSLAITSPNNLSSFTASQKVRNGRSNSFNARTGWALVSSLLPVLPKSISSSALFELNGIWEAFPERPDIFQYSRKFALDFIPNGVFGRFLSRLMQVTHLVKCWSNAAILSPEPVLNAVSSHDLTQRPNERILVYVDHESNTIEITTRLVKASMLSSQIYSIFDSLIGKYYKITYKSLISCSHCVSHRMSTPYYFKLDDIESTLFKGELNVYCQYSRYIGGSNSNNGADLNSGSGSTGTKSPSGGNNTPRTNVSTNSGSVSSRKESKGSPASASVLENVSSNRKDSKGSHSPLSGVFNIERKESNSSLGSSSGSVQPLDLSTPVPIKSILLDQYALMQYIKEIDFKEIEVLPADHTMNESGFVSHSMGMYGNQFVNIKTFNQPSSNDPSLCSKVMSMFRQEALSLYSFRHSNVLSIIGVSLNPIAIITENPTFGNKGSTTLSEYIQDRQKHPEIPWNIKLKIAIDIARAMEKLQSQTYLLTNLNSSSIVLEKSNKNTGTANGKEDNEEENDGVIAKLSDFSMASPLSSLFPSNTSPKPWNSPEVLQKLHYHELTDVYSYGIILYELLTRSIAFQDHERFANMVISGQRPSIPPDCLPSFADLIKDCWSGDPLNRPTFQYVISQLLLIKKEIESRENNYKSLASDTNIYSNFPLPSGGSIIYQDKIIHFGGWNGSTKPHSNVYALNLTSMLFEDKLNVVLNNKQSSTYKAFYSHMQSEYNEENLVFYEAIKTFKALPNVTPEDREIIKIQAKKIFQAFIGNDAPKEINLPFALKTELKKKIESVDGPSVTVFNDTLSFVISSIDDSFHRFKFATPSTSKNGWVCINCKGNAPPPMVGHSSVLWNGHLVVIGGWFERSRQLSQIYLLNLESFEWNTYTCTGDIPPSSSAAMNTTLHGDYLLVYYERADTTSQQTVYRLSLDSFVWFGLKLSNISNNPLNDI